MADDTLIERLLLQQAAMPAGAAKLLASKLPNILANTGVPVILLSSASAITATGAITGLTALPYTPSGVVQVYCFAQTGLTAGLYYARFSSTTACQLYVDVAGTVTPTGISAGAYAGGTTEATLVSVTVPGGAMGNNGALRYEAVSSIPNNANSKTVQAKFAGTAFATIAATTSAGVRLLNSIRNRGSQTVNTGTAAGLGAQGIGGLSGASQQTTIDTTTNQVFTFTATLANAADYVILDGYAVEVLPGA